VGVSSPEFFSVRDLSDPRVRIQWHEAVAVVAAIATWADDLGVEYLPDIDALGLSTDGQPVVDAGATDGDRAVRQLGRTLQALLNDDAPGQIADLADQALGAPDDDRAGQFAASLRFYERPNRSELLRGLVARASLLVSERVAEQEFDRLQERAREQAAHQVAPAAAPPQPVARRAGISRRRIAALLLVMAVAAAATIAFVPAVRGVTVAPLARLLEPTPIEPKPLPSELPDDASPRADGRAQAARSSGVGTPPDLANQADATRAASVVDDAPSPHEALFTVITEDPRAATPLDDAGDRIYTASAPGITPPVLLRQHLPSEPPPGVGPDEVGVFDLVIDSSGAVERVQLTSPTNRFQERMLVAAAKAWKFKPASRGGIPVRCRLKMRVTW
jgi:hypothetical protein